MEALLKELEIAIKNEEMGQKHYARLAEMAADPKVKAMFEQLKKDEETHEKLLRSRYEAIARLVEKGSDG